MGRLSLMLGLIGLLAITPAEGRGANPSLGPLTPPENYILAQVAAGTSADLRQAFGPDAKSRQVRAGFLVNLLTGAFTNLRIPYQGISLHHAEILDPLNLENAEVHHWVELFDCHFQAPVTLRDACFTKGLTLSRCRFAAPVEAQRLRVGLSVNLGESVFSGPVDFWRSQINGTLLADGLHCEDSTSTAKFSSVAVGQVVLWRQAVFRGPVDFSGFKTGDSVQFSGSAFAGPVNFFGAQIGGQLVIQQTQYGGAADFGYVSVASQLLADGLRCLSPTAQATFNSMKVTHSASFRQAVFAGPVNFISATCGSEFHADGVQFTGTTAEVNFTNLTVQQHAFYREAQFHGPVSFIGANIGGELAFIRTRFLNAEAMPTLRELRVEETFYLWDTVCAGGVDLSGSRLFKAILGYPAAHKGTLSRLVLENAVIERLLKIEHLEIGQLEARKLTVKDEATFDSVAVAQRADLRESSCGNWTFRDTTWPSQPESFWLEGMTYRAIGAGEAATAWRSLLALVEDSRYDSRAYTQLENYFKQGGYKDYADTVYIQGQRREALQQWWRLDNLATLVFWDLLAGYGRKPGRTFWVSLAIVVLGMGVFKPRNFDPTFLSHWNWLQDGSRRKSLAVRFLLSLDQFLPGIDLGLAKLWQLADISFGELIYYHFHKLAGWILIPIGLAAIYSQFR